MDAVEDVKVGPLTAGSSSSSPSGCTTRRCVLKPGHGGLYWPVALATTDKVNKVWDLVSLHDSVSVILFNTDRQKLVMVRQFRPAVYYSGIPKEARQASEGCIDTSKYPARSGLTLELCAGIVDKQGSLEEGVRLEALEECGYDVPLKNFEHVKTFRSGVGVSGDRQTMFYAEVTDKMKVSEGGGLEEEGELIDVVEMSVPEVKDFLSKPEVLAPAGFLYAISWFLLHKAPATTTSAAT
ncbi:Uridine diphosphate glucose pyrophosphatase [Chionoecetes opilio]|uniref:Uridine diphosphate glucose pyrophosphatase NUDT14 n=1 Tax=Chionoecetes opilio TaxID=41210 RepID=A0A8J4XQY3_CHIOP|nr:Uridine diphosphate glucose pyrophosphatase [Chionoecetes opilio]